MIVLPTIINSIVPKLKGFNHLGECRVGQIGKTNQLDTVTKLTNCKSIYIWNFGVLDHIGKIKIENQHGFSASTSVVCSPREDGPLAHQGILISIHTVIFHKKKKRKIHIPHNSKSQIPSQGQLHNKIGSGFKFSCCDLEIWFRRFLVASSFHGRFIWWLLLRFSQDSEWQTKINSKFLIRKKVGNRKAKHSLLASQRDHHSL